jgi:hypothetical protein
MGKEAYPGPELSALLIRVYLWLQLSLPMSVGSRYILAAEIESPDSIAE